MRILKSTNNARRAKLTQSFWSGHDLLVVDGHAYQLPEDIQFSRSGQDVRETSPLLGVVCVVLALTIIGILLALVLWYFARRPVLTVSLRMTDGQVLALQASTRAEARVLRRYAGILPPTMPAELGT